MSLNPNPDNFVTECPIKTRSRTYTLDWTDGNITIFKSPDGFQYDRYFDAMFPDHTLQFFYTGDQDNATDRTLNIIVKKDENIILKVTAD